LGPVYVVAAILLSSRLGFAAFQIAAISGQLTSSLICDAVGLLHLQKRRPTARRVFAVLIAIMGASLTSSSVKVHGSPLLFVLYCAVAFSAGCIFPVQACVNRVMQDYVLTPYRAVVVSFSGGAFILMVLSLLLSTISDEPFEIASGEPWMWTGGLCGAAVVTTNVVGLPTIGAAAFMTVFLASQLTAAFVFDTLGAFDFEALEPKPLRACGVVLTIGAAISYQLQPPLNGQRGTTKHAVETSSVDVVPSQGTGCGTACTEVTAGADSVTALKSEGQSNNKTGSYFSMGHLFCSVCR